MTVSQVHEPGVRLVGSTTIAKPRAPCMSRNLDGQLTHSGAEDTRRSGTCGREAGVGGGGGGGGGVGEGALGFFFLDWIEVKYGYFVGIELKH